MHAIACLLTVVLSAPSLDEESMEEFLAKLRSAEERLSEIRKDLDKHREEGRKAKARVQEFLDGECKLCMKPHAECTDKVNCEPQCNRDLEELKRPLMEAVERLKKLEKERKEIRREWSRRLAQLEVELTHLHDRIRTLLAVRDRLRAIQGNLEKDRESWKKERMQTLWDAVNHLKVALRDRFSVLSKWVPPGSNKVTYWRLVDNIDRACKEYEKAKSAKDRKERLHRITESLQHLANAGSQLAILAGPRFKHEILIATHSLQAGVNATQAFLRWQEHGWDVAAAKEVRATLNSVGIVMAMGSKYYKGLAVYGKALAVGVTAEELTEDAAGALFASVAIARLNWQLGLHTYDQSHVQDQLAQLGEEYKLKDQKKRLIQAMLAK